MYFKPQIKKSKIIIANPKLKHKNSNSSISKHKCTNSNSVSHPQKIHNKFAIYGCEMCVGGIAPLIILLGAIFCQGGDGTSHTTLTKLAYKSFIKDAIPPTHIPHP